MIGGYGNLGPVSSPAEIWEYRASLTPDLSKSNVFQVTLGGNVTIQNPVNVPQDGTPLLMVFIQDGAGSRLLTLGSQFTLGATVTSYTLSTAIGARDLIGCRYCKSAVKWDILSVVLGYS